MKILSTHFNLLLTFLLAAGFAMAQNSDPSNSTTKNQTEMKTYMIEREIPGAGNLTADELKAISQTSCTVLKEMGPKIEWVHSYVTGNRITCIYKAESIDLIREHAKKGGFPANNIIEVKNVISPKTAE